MTFIVKAKAFGADKPISLDNQFKGNFTKSDELVGLPIRNNLNPFAQNAFPILHAHTFSFAVTGFGITGIGIACCIVPSALKTYM